MVVYKGDKYTHKEWIEEMPVEYEKVGGVKKISVETVPENLKKKIIGVLKKRRKELDGVPIYF